MSQREKDVNLRVVQANKDFFDHSLLDFILN